MGKFKDLVDKTKPTEPVVVATPEKVVTTTEPSSTDVEPTKVEAVVKTEPSVVSEPSVTKKDFDLDEWLGGIPEEARSGLNKRITENTTVAYTKYVNEKYGKILPLIEGLEKDPTLMDGLAKLSPFLLEEISKDPDLIDDVLKLSDKDFRTFIFETGEPIYRGTDTIDPVVNKKLSDLESKLNKKEKAEQEAIRRAENEALTNKQREEREAAQKKFNADRMNELQAFINEHPECHYKKQSPDDQAWSLVMHIARMADAETSANWSKGIHKVVPYQEVYQEYRRTLGTPPKAIPATTPAGPSKATIAKPSTQAPTNVAETKRKLHDEIEQAGGFARWAAAKSNK